MNTYISFVIPAFNCALTVKETVESIFNGNFQKGDEIIIINDCSEDNSLNIIKDIQKLYPVLKIINNKHNLGCPASRNIGIEKSTNKLIFNLDADNILAPNSIPLLKDYLLKNTADAAAFGEISFFTSDIRNISHKWIFNNKHFYLQDLLASHINPGPAGNFLYSKYIWAKVGKYWEYGKGLHEAWGFHLKLLAKGAKYVVLPNYYYFHRYGHESLYIRESKSTDNDIKLTNKMIKPFLNLINVEDVKYIKNNNWFKDLNDHPIRTNNHRVGFKGEVILVKKPLKYMIIEHIYKIFK